MKQEVNPVVFFVAIGVALVIAGVVSYNAISGGLKSSVREPVRMIMVQPNGVGDPKQPTSRP